jgi:hypothetical protein
MIYNPAYTMVTYAPPQLDHIQLPLCAPPTAGGPWVIKVPFNSSVLHHCCTPSTSNPCDSLKVGRVGLVLRMRNVRLREALIGSLPVRIPTQHGLPTAPVLLPCRQASVRSLHCKQRGDFCCCSLNPLSYP